MFKIRMKTGGRIYPVTAKLILHNESEVIEVDDKGEFKRIVDPTEFSDMTVEEMNAESTPAPKPKKAKKAPPKKVSKKTEKKAADSAVSNAPSLESVDVSSL
jgi:hypothetical protein